MSRYQGVPDRWAAHNEGRSKYSSKTGKRCSFNGAIFYSYQTPVAMYHRNAYGELFVLASSDKWSVSTSSHLRAAIWSTGVPVFKAPLIGASSGMHREDLQMPPETMHARNAAANMATALEFEATYAKCWRRATTGAADYMLRHIETIVVNVDQYCELTATELPANYVSFETIAGRLREGWRQAKAKYEDPKAVRARERARARRLAAEVMEY